VSHQDNFLGRRRVYGHALVKVGFGQAGPDGDGESLEHLVRVDSKKVKANNLMKT
jgi:hypothetical protein